METVFLFGSWVEGTNTASSDLDVVVILNSPQTTNFRLMPFVLEDVTVESMCTIMLNSMISRQLQKPLDSFLNPSTSFHSIIR